MKIPNIPEAEFEERRERFFEPAEYFTIKKADGTVKRVRASTKPVERERPNTRMNDVHDPKTGRFGFKSGRSKTLPNGDIQYTDTKNRTTLFKRVNGEQFAGELRSAYDRTSPDDKWRVAVNDHTAEEYDGMKCFVTENGSTVAIKPNGDIISVCKNPTGVDRGSTLLEFAIDNGGTKLDSYDGNHAFYSKMGFEPVSWTEFNKKYVQSAWYTYGEPENVIFYKYTGRKNVVTDLGSWYNSHKPLDYDEATRVRDEDMK